MHRSGCIGDAALQSGVHIVPPELGELQTEPVEQEEVAEHEADAGRQVRRDHQQQLVASRNARLEDGQDIQRPVAVLWNSRLVVVFRPLRRKRGDNAITDCIVHASGQSADLEAGQYG